MSVSTEIRDSSLSIYDNLPTTSSTRILSLLHAVDNEPLVLELKVIDLNSEDHQQYDAVSYAWGSTELTESVICHSEHGSATIRITSNLASAFRRLHHLQDRHISSWLWADALSINQSMHQEALEERAQQVQMMNRIFQSARRVIADLGQEPIHFELLDTSIDKIMKLPDEDWKMIEGGEGIPPDLKDLGSDLRLLQSVGELYARPYFIRVWTLQEFILADEIHFLVGTKLYDGELFAPAILRVAQFLFLAIPSASWQDFDIQKALGSWGPKQSGLTQMRRLHPLRQLRRNGALKDFSVCKLISKAWDCRSTDPRDKFYALHGLASEIDWRGAEEIRVDYTKDVDSLSLDVTKLFLREKESTLRLFDLMSRVNSHLPSWCLDLKTSNELVERDFLLDKIDITAKHFYASRETAIDIELGPSDKFIIISACVIDQVTRLGPAEPPTGETQIDMAKEVENQHQWCQEMIRWTEDVLFQIPRDKLAEIRWRTLCADTYLKSTTPKPTRARATAEIGIYYSAYVEYIKHIREKLKDKFTLVDDDVERGERALKWGLYVGDFEEGRIGYTEHERLGMFPKDIMIGDEIAIISGLQLPFVLRRQKDETYRIVGECYLHGVMDGEAFDEEGFGFSKILIS